jgi:hypothetical protein
MGYGLEARLSLLGKGSAPASDGTRGRFDVSSDRADAPAGRQQRDGHSVCRRLDRSS